MNLDWKTVVAAAVTWTGIVAGGTWTVGQRYNEGLRETIESYEKTKSWKVPEAVAATEKAANELGKLAADINTLDALRASEGDLKLQLAAAKANGAEQINDLKSEMTSERTRAAKDLAERTQAIQALQSQLEKLAPAYAEIKSIVVQENGSAQLFDDKLSLGVSTIYPGFASCLINNRSEIMHPGQWSEVKVGPLTFRVTARTIKDKEKELEFQAVLLK